MQLVSDKLLNKGVMEALIVHSGRKPTLGKSGSDGLWMTLVDGSHGAGLADRGW
jgi:hypothetical protein